MSITGLRIGQNNAGIGRGKMLTFQKAVDGKGYSYYNIRTVAIRRVYGDCQGEVAKGGITVSEVRVKENESLESALKRFKRQCARAGVLAEVRKREHYEKPSVKRKKKAEAARKRKY